MFFNHLKRTIPLFLLVALFITPLSACQKRIDPLAKSGFSSLTIGKKNRINAEITLDSHELQKHAGEAIFLYELLPDEELAALADKMRALFDRAREKDAKIEFLSMGMSGDYKLCIEHGSNMIRVGSTIFGKRNYV